MASAECKYKNWPNDRFYEIDYESVIQYRTGYEKEIPMPRRSVQHWEFLCDVWGLLSVTLQS